MTERLSKPKSEYSKQTDELCHLFSSTLQSLSADATAIRQLSSLSNLISEDEENHQPNRRNRGCSGKRLGNNTAIEKDNTTSSDGKDDTSHLAQLQSLDRAVTSIEQKVTALRSIVSEEKRAIAHFEGSLREECKAQQLAVENILQAYQEVQTNEQVIVPPKRKPESMTIPEETGPRSIPVSSCISATHSETCNTSPIQRRRAEKTRRDSVDPRVDRNVQPAKNNPDEDDNQVSFALVTDKELSRISRNSRRRINLLDLNEALEEIEYVAENKFDSIPSQKSFSSASQQRRFEYLRQQRGSSYQDIEVEAHQGHFWVSEQELRETCVFFRNGESTARAILSILCSLRRLKQIPGKKRQVTYLCLVRDNNERSGDHV
ncbi:unnamed protein product [Cylindrotheca closterium]|uniref:Spindle and kinetochore-associated protein 1 n=1 Tax=Cylindrotheca closterium TaxID=2856 RepID=A0AAD2FDJ0_9STRA|nr:unnamed protein product [Cylindrotheca closterium]